MPKISIIAGCFNNAEFLDQALESVCKQTFTDFEMLVIDDASTDTSLQNLQRWAEKEKRLRVLENPRNIGLANTLNRAIESSDSEYIARFDTDDIMYPERLAKQISYMQSNRIDLLGSAIQSIGQRRSKQTTYPQTDEHIRIHLLFQTAFAHPTVIYQRNKLGALRYNPEIRYAEDYALWVKMAERAKMANLAEPLLFYRQHDKQVSNNKNRQNQDAGKVRLEALKAANLNCSTEERQIHSRLRHSNPYQNRKELEDTESWLIKLENHLQSRLARQHIQREWYLCCIRAAHFGWWTWQRYCSSPLTVNMASNKLHDQQLRLLCLGKIRYQSNIYNLLEAI